MASFTDIELQPKVLGQLDRSTLAAMCRTNKGISAVTTKMLWGDIDFVALKDSQRLNAQQVQKAMHDFFVACDRLIDANLERWQYLARLVKVLRLVQLPSFAVPYTEDGSDGGWNMFKLGQGPPRGRSIYQIMSYFDNLEHLHFYIRESVDLMHGTEPGLELIQGKLSKLKTVEIGGNITSGMVSGILSSPETIETLSCINLQDGSASQNYHSHPSIFLNTVAPRLTALRKLHLCMLSDASNGNGSEVPYPWEPQHDNEAFAEWTYALISTWPTLEELILESSYVVPGHDSGLMHNFQDMAEIPVKYDGEESGEYGSISSQRFHGMVLPVLAALRWPKLKKIKFVGVHVGASALKRTGVLKSMNPETEIQVLPGRKAEYKWGAASIVISPPDGTFQGKQMNDPARRQGHIVNR